MKRAGVLLYMAVAGVCMSGVYGQSVSVEWMNVTNRVNESGKPEYVQRFVISGDPATLKGIGFNQFDAELKAMNPSDKVSRIIPSYFKIESDRFSSGKDSIQIDIVTSGMWSMYSFGADGIHGIGLDDKPFDVSVSRSRGTSSKDQYSLPGRDAMPYGDVIYDINERIGGGKTPGRFDIFPSLKQVSEGEGFNKNPQQYVEFNYIHHEIPGFYQIVIKEDSVYVNVTSQEANRNARVTLDRLKERNGGNLPLGVIEDWPDFPYRGLMIDISRNRQTIEELKKIVKLMSEYKLNALQFHLIDDEGWRLEIPGLPELTEIGSKRGYGENERNYLAQTYSGNGNPESDTYGNGYLTRSEFIDFLKYCNKLGVRVIPEVETPGHARAAIKAMEERYRRTGDASYRLIEDGDTSVYHSAQDYTDNAMNPALPGPYLFMEKVFEEIKSMYDEAGIPLVSIHIGGDEVPSGAWSGSPSAQKMMKDKGFTTESQLHAYWAQEMANMLKSKGMKVSGWQDIVVDKDSAFATTLIPEIEFVNLWVTWPQGDETETPVTKAQRMNIPIVLSSANGYYFDMAYDRHPDEPGLIWAGVTDEFLSLNTYPSQMAPIENGGTVLGVQGQLWSESVRGGDMLEYYLFPKMLGMVERSWNGFKTYSDKDYNTLIDLEFDKLNEKGVNFRLRQAGIKQGEDGKIMMNSPYQDAVIRYTTDNSEPTANSTVYTEPFPAGNDVKVVRARLYHKGKESVTSILYLNTD